MLQTRYTSPLILINARRMRTRVKVGLLCVCVCPPFANAIKRLLCVCVCVCPPTIKRYIAF